VSIDRQKVIDSAQKFAAKGQFDKAIAEYMRIVKEDPSDVRVLLKIGDLQVRKGAKEDAVATYSRVAAGYDQQGFFLKAIAVYKQILSIDPTLTELYSKLADLYVKLGLLPEALANLDALAGRYARAGQDEKVVAVLRQMVEVDPSSVPSHIKLAELLSKLGKAEDAAKEFEAGAKLLLEARRVDDWAKVAERLLFHRPNDAKVAKELAQHYLARQDAKRALPKLQVSFKANSKDTETLEMLAQAFREFGQLPKTISVYKEIAKIHGDAGAQDKRLAMFQKVLELSPNDAEAKEALRGSSRVGRRPSAPPPAQDATGSRKAGAPPTNEAAAAKKPSSPQMPAVSTAAKSAPPPETEEDVEEIVVEDAEDEVVYDLKPSKPPAAAAPSAARQPSGPLPAAGSPQMTAPLPLNQRRVPAPAPAAPVASPATGSHRVAGPADVTRLIAEADIFVKYGLKQKALAHLQNAVQIDALNIEVHARLRDLYTEMGDGVAAAHHSTTAAEIISPTDPESALAEVTHALQLDPSNEAGIALYTQLTGQPPYGEEVSAEYAQDQLQQGYPDDAYAAAEYARQGDEGAASAEGAATGRDIEEGLDEAEFFVTQGLYDEARDTLTQLLEAHPGHPLIIERLEELEAMLQAQAAPAEDQSFALAEKLAEEVQNVQEASGAHFDDGGQMIDVETVFEQFKKGIEKTVSADDADTHYDLGIAYKEMGLTEDAVSEFNVAAQNPKRQCIAETMIGLCYMERNDVATAIEHFKRALQAAAKTDREEMGLYFELGNAYESVGDLSEAMYFFQKVEKRDPSFRNVHARVQRLAAHVNSGTRTQPNEPEMDDVDRAFDELLKG
jgi:tetratricopeptide (TPR) repeat protein